MMKQNLSTIEMVQNLKNVNKLVAMELLHGQGYNFQLGIDKQSNEVADKVTKMLLDEDSPEDNEVTNEVVEATPQPVTNEAPQDEAPQQDPTKQTKKVEDLTDALNVAYQRRTLKQAKVRTSARMALISVICNATKMKLNDKRTAQLEQHIKDATTLEDLTAKVVTMMHPRHK